MASRYANRPVELPVEYNQAREAIFRTLEQQRAEQ
jgi:hypothetical protein